MICFSFGIVQSSDCWRKKVVSCSEFEQRNVRVNERVESLWLQQLVIAKDFGEREWEELRKSLTTPFSLHHKYAVVFKDQESDNALMYDRVAYEQRYKDEILKESVVVGFETNSRNQNSGIALAIKQALIEDVEKSLRQL